MRKILLDQGCPRSLAHFLDRSVWDVAHVGELGMSRSSDADILEWARRNDRICITLDADFHTLLAVTGAASPSTIRIRVEGLKADALARLLVDEWPKMGKALEAGSMVSITERNIRIRSLPVA